MSDQVCALEVKQFVCPKIRPISEVAHGRELAYGDNKVDCNENFVILDSYDAMLLNEKG